MSIFIRPHSVLMHLSSLFVLLLLSSLTLLAQSSLATIAGVVTDSQGAAVSGASITATSGDAGVATESKTNASGVYSLSNFSVGQYTVAVQRDGFSRFVATGVLLSTGQVYGLNAALQPGGVTQSVTVQDQHAELETRSSEIGQIIESKSVADLPLGDRTSMNIISLTGGAVFIDSANYSLAGGRTKSSMTWLDGGSGQNFRLGIGTAEVSPPVDAIQELGIITNNYAAEYGGSAGGINVQTTKSGTNRLHGTLYEFLRNDAFDAPGYFAAMTNGIKRKPELRYNVYGGTIGGPIIKDRTFFFFGYEGSRQLTGSNVTLTVPTLLERSGDFSQAGVNIYDPTSTRSVAGIATRTQFANNRIPLGQIDPVAHKILAYYPSPTSAGAANNFTANDVASSQAQFYIARVDHVLGPNDRIAGRYIFSKGLTSNRSVYPDKGADPYQPSISNDNVGYGQWIRTISPAIVNDLRFTFETRVNHQLSDGVGGDCATKLGLTGVSASAFPSIAPVGFSPLGSTTQERRQYPINQYQLVDDLSWLLGRHSIKLGAELRRSMDHEVNLSTASGAFTFATQATGQPGLNNTGNGLASMLVGFPTAFSEAQMDPVTRTSWYVVGFAQDDFTLTPSLTLNLGLRWETDTPIKDEANRMNSFNPTTINPISGTQGVVKFLGVNGYRTTPYSTDLNNFAPRLGFAWQPFHSASTVDRGGAGYFFAHPFDAGQPASAAWLQRSRRA